MFSIGNKIRLTIFGQSHAKAIGGVLEGIPAGVRLDQEAIAVLMNRRAPGSSSLTTPRTERDEVIILSGLADGVTCGAPLAFMIENKDTRSDDYSKLKDVPRPMHSDYPAFMKHHGCNDIRGGGQYSGRLTAPVCFAGAVCAQLLTEKGISIGSHLFSIGEVSDEAFDPVKVDEALFVSLRNKLLPVISDEAAGKMIDRIESARRHSDSVGGIVECAVVGLPVGLGDPMFDGIENLLARALFGIPAVKGVDFGAGFNAARMSGSEHNDPFEINAEGRIVTSSNRHGGILAGMTTGMPLVFRAAFKPTASIGFEQDSVSLSRHENVKLTIEGRHDPCIVIRAYAAVEAVTALVIYDLIAQKG